MGTIVRNNLLTKRTESDGKIVGFNSFAFQKQQHVFTSPITNRLPMGALAPTRTGPNGIPTIPRQSE